MSQETQIAVSLVREIFKEMFAAHETTIASIISANTKIVNERLDKISDELRQTNNKLISMDKDIADLKESLDTTHF